MATSQPHINISKKATAIVRWVHQCLLLINRTLEKWEQATNQNTYFYLEMKQKQTKQKLVTQLMGNEIFCEMTSLSYR